MFDMAVPGRSGDLEPKREGERGREKVDEFSMRMVSRSGFRICCPCVGDMGMAPSGRPLAFCLDCVFPMGSNGSLGSSNFFCPNNTPLAAARDAERLAVLFPFVQSAAGCARFERGTEPSLQVGPTQAQKPFWVKWSRYHVPSYPGYPGKRLEPLVP